MFSCLPYTEGIKFSIKMSTVCCEKNSHDPNRKKIVCLAKISKVV
jgi:hypothetical protein